MSIGPFGKGVLRNWSVVEETGSALPPVSDYKAVPKRGELPSEILGSGDDFVLSFAGFARVHVSFANRQVTVFDIGPDADDDTLTHFLCDHVAPRVLAQLGRFVLHGSAIEMGGRAVIFIGETGAGKSTLAASLQRAGHRLMGDDAVIVTERRDAFVAEPVYPSLRLYPDTVSVLLAPDAEVAPMARYSDKQRIEVPPASNPSVPIAAIFLLSGDGEAESVSITRPAPAAACIALLEQSFAMDPGDAARAAHRMATASRLTESVAVFSAQFPFDYDRLDEVHAAIEDRVRESEMLRAGAN